MVMKRLLRLLPFVLTLPIAVVSCQNNKIQPEEADSELKNDVKNPKNSKNDEQEQQKPKNENEKPIQNQEKPQKPNSDDENQTPITDNIKIAHWNVLNQSDKNIFKTKAIASIIFKSNFDLVGLTEIVSVAGANAILEEIKKMETNNANQWSILVSEPSKSITGPNQSERVAFIYKANKVKPKAFINSKIGSFYENKPWTSDLIDNSQITYDYVRPPFGVLFETQGKIKNDFTFVIAHLDSPGAKKKAGETSAPGFSGQGRKEINEALNLVSVMKWFDQIDGENDELIFMGDTNIKIGNASKAFKPLIDDGYKFYTEDTEKWKSSLSSKINKYANTYDKIIYKGSLKANNSGVFDLWNAITNQYLPQKWLDDYKNYKSYKSKESYFRYGISDHTPVYFELIINSSDKH